MLVSATLWVALVPVVKLPKPSEVGDAESCKVEETPVPAKATANEELGELFTSVRLPEIVPAEAGANLTEKEEEPPGGTVRGSANPEKLKPVPGKRAWVRLRFAVPGLLMVKVCELAEPRIALPKLVLAGFTEICGWIPEPLRAMVAGELVALLTTVRFPAALPTMAGEKLTARERLWPAARVTLPLKPLTLNPVPVEETWEMVTLPVPVFASEMA